MGGVQWSKETGYKTPINFILTNFILHENKNRSQLTLNDNSQDIGKTLINVLLMTQETRNYISQTTSTG